MVQKEIGLSRDLIIHPGETLAEVLEDRNMSQKELAIRTGVTEKHISTVLHGQKGISAVFAKKLEYALGIEAAFWMNLQSNYDRELLEFEEVNNISEEEIGVVKSLKEVLEHWNMLGWVNTKLNSALQVLDLRKFFRISNLLDTPKIQYSGTYRIQNKNVNVDPYILFAWQTMCEKLTEDNSVENKINTGLLREKIPEIKKVMFLKANQIQTSLAAIFSECGIVFRIVPNYTGAPVQGFIKKTDKDRLILCMTIRQQFADIFWFTLFHEIAHILNEDFKTVFVDFDSTSGEMESKVDTKAWQYLIDSDSYKAFVSEGNFSYAKVREFAETQGVRDYIVSGRLKKEELIPWSAQLSTRVKYSWT